MPVKYGDWLRYVMRAEGARADHIVEESGLTSGRVEELMASRGAEPTRDEIDRIARALEIPPQNMERSLKAMQTYDRIADFGNECQWACCPWNAPIA